MSNSKVFPKLLIAFIGSWQFVSWILAQGGIVKLFSGFFGISSNAVGMESVLGAVIGITILEIPAIAAAITLFVQRLQQPLYQNEVKG